MYDFTTVLDRRGRDSVAADKIPFAGVIPDEGVTPIPMWVADMSYPVAPPVLEAMRQRLEYPFLGYFDLSDDYYAAIIDWQRRRNGVQGLTKEHIGYENGVLGGVASAVQMLTAAGEPILVHVPTYVGFTGTLRNLGREIVHSELKRDGVGVWRMDFEDMDRRLKERQIHLAIFCSPHNPSGRVWERWELEKAMEVYAANDCLVISDEIWSDIIMPGYRHIPTQSISEDARQRTLAFYAPSKSFSLAGLVGSYHIVYNAYLRHRLRRQSEQESYNHANVLSMHALIGAFNEGEAWLEEMCRAVDENFAEACGFFAGVPGVSLMRPQGTYMLYLDVSGYLRERGETLETLLHRGVRAGVIWQSGAAFAMPDTIRMNLALPLSQLREALGRLRASVL